MSLEIHVINVEQGDTLLLTWKENLDAERKYGLIDCNLVNGGIDPLRKRLEKLCPDLRMKFDFVIMSHPHSDHFSGFHLLFNFCKENNITIEKFIHTGGYDPRYFTSLLVDKQKNKKELCNAITAAANRSKHKSSLLRLFLFLHKELKGKKVIKEVYVARSSSKDLMLTQDIKLSFLSPDDSYEIEKYIRSTYNMTTTDNAVFMELPENNPHANLLSTLINIHNDKHEWNILLCSDIEKDTLERLSHSTSFGKLSNGKLLVAQIPHHGSGKNHSNSFWEAFIDLKGANTFISVGDGYGHPSSRVIEFFELNSKSLHSTNYVGGYKDYHDKKAATSKTKIRNKLISSYLDFLKTNLKPKTYMKPKIECGEKHIIIINDEAQIYNTIGTV